MSLGTSCEVQNLVGNLLLPTLIVLEREFLKKVFAIVGCGLHGHGTGRMLCRSAVKQRRKEPDFHRLWIQRLQKLLTGWLQDDVGGRFLDYAFGSARNDKRATTAPSVKAGVEMALREAGKDAIIYIGGSAFVVAEALQGTELE